MVRTPPGYNRRAGGWPPGWVVPAGSHVDRRVLPRSVDPRQYATPAQVPIGPYGFAQGTIPGGTASASTNAPASFFTFDILAPNPPAGVYTVTWSVTLAGTVGAPEVNNFALMHGPAGGPHTLIAQSVNAGAVGTYKQATQVVTLSGAETLVVKSWNNNGTGGSVYSATLTASARLVIGVGPAGFRTSWDLAQASIGTTTGAADSSTAELFAQPYGPPMPAFQVGQSYAAGGDQVGLAGVKLVTGEFLFVVWSGANPGDTATLVLSGNQTVLT